jgi:predicted RecB family nuclease
VYESDDMLFVSPTDLTKYLGCHHATRLDLAVARGELPRPDEGIDETLELLFSRGLEHEARYLQSLRDDGRTVVEIEMRGKDAASLADAERATEAAMASGADVVYQATFFDGQWRGHADFLLRRDDRPGRWPWSYDVADTKLARRLKVAALLQMATYADRLTLLQGIAPERLIVITGDRAEHSYGFDDCAAYATLIRAQMLDFIATDDDPHPRPVRQCDQCRWRPRCRAQWRREDDLSLVAFMSGAHAATLRNAGMTTVRELGEARADTLPSKIGAPARERLTAQARLQLVERDTKQPAYELLEPEAGRGFALLPAPSPGDVFFDIEGDPFLGDHGLEYLFGVVDRDGFTAYWATEEAQEKKAFEELVDHLMSAWESDPGMHVYHYAPYEPARLKSLSGRYDTRGVEVDRLLRGQRLVDLYAVVRQGMRISKESYSIKQLEAFYWGHIRTHEGVSDALGSVVAFERWLADGDQALLDDIAKYNEDDCRSTQALRDWLETLRTEGGGDAAYPRPEHGDGSASDTALLIASDVERLSAALTTDIPDEPREQQQARTLLAGLLDWHRRESLPEWWDHFHRLQLSDEELVHEPAAIGELSAPVRAREEKQSTVWRMTFPPQDTKVHPDKDYLDPRTAKAAGTVVAIDAEQGWLELKRATKRGAPECTSLVPTAPIADTEQRARLRELGEWVVAHGIASENAEWRAARDLLLRRHPHVAGGPGTTLRRSDEPAEQALCRLASELEYSVLPVQGPPGTGKTWAGARMILRLVGEGKTVGVAAFSHKAIGNLLAAVCDAAEPGQSLRILQKAAAHERCVHDLVDVIESAGDVEQALQAGEVDIVAGTSWLFARPGMAKRVDVLVVDEAGQLSLANVLAISAAAQSVVLLGDPQQLAQPVKGQHPSGAEASALEHLLDGRATVQPDRGLLLDTTWRMHSDVAGFVSRRFYDGKLGVESDCEAQRVHSTALLGGTGLRFVPVAHAGNTAASSEEADVVAELCRYVLADGRWTDRHGATRSLTGADILVLTPFNAQVNRVRGRLASIDPGIRIGTVDKFQGQEAPVVIYSLASSSVDDAPRGLEFLYSLNRFNVAISRARAVMAVVCSPSLLSPLVQKPEQLRMVNALCSFREAADASAGRAGQPMR